MRLLPQALYIGVLLLLVRHDLYPNHYRINVSVLCVGFVVDLGLRNVRVIISNVMMLCVVQC